MSNTIANVTRNNLFYSERDFQLENDIMLGYLEEDLNQTVVVFEVDRERTNTNLYKESKGIRFKNKTEIPCYYEILENTLKSHGMHEGGMYVVRGNLTVYTLASVFKKYNCDIKRGDYIGVLVDNNRMAYYSVTDDGKVNIDNKKNIGAYRLAWMKITAIPITEAEFNGE